VPDADTDRNRRPSRRSKVDAARAICFLFTNDLLV
jgi:hypothetical protein